MHTMLTHAVFSANSSLGITLLEEKYYFMSVKLCYLWYFSQMQLKKLEHILCVSDSRQLTNPLKILFKIGSLLSCLLVHAFFFF